MSMNSEMMMTIEEARMIVHTTDAACDAAEKAWHRTATAGDVWKAKKAKKACESVVVNVVRKAGMWWSNWSKAKKLAEVEAWVREARKIVNFDDERQMLRQAAGLRDGDTVEPIRQRIM
jgi:hypothetical protein